MARNRARRRPMSEINVVPYIDVMLVLLVIFVITAPLLSQGVKVDLPQADAQPLDVESHEPLVVTIDSTGSYYVNYGENQRSPVEPGVLAARVAALLRHRPELSVVVRGDENVPYGDVVLLMTILQSAGAPSVGLMTETPQETR
ncbi:MAG: protein TolR [Thiotrichales bacterium]|nr:protein TolR [Thiotrichales bacterium]MCY4349966.1 protein TolR [Thiotrichales bacterium]